MSYNSLLAAETNSISSFKGNFTFYYIANFTSNESLSTIPLNLKFSIPSNYTIYREGNVNSTAFKTYYNVGEVLTFQNILNNNTLVNSIREYIDNGTKLIYNLSKLKQLIGKYNIYMPLSKMAFVNNTGFYICSAYPSLSNSSILSKFSCGLVSNSTAFGIKYLIDNITQVTSYSFGFDINQLNLTMQYVGISKFLNQTCSEYNLHSTVKSYLISNVYVNSTAYVNGKECISNKFYLPLYQYINATIPSKGVYFSFNLTLKASSNKVFTNITTFPENHALNLTYGNYS
ncbi:MAG: hypothetical protein ACP5MV_03400 [Candidatus Parvarchaeum sp.]